MNTRVRFDSDRAELLPMDGLSVRLRAQITAAMEAGDEAQVLDLQRQYRERPLPGRSRSGGSTARAVLQVVGSVVHTATSAEVRGLGNVLRQIKGYLVTWGPQPTAVGADGAEDVVMLDVQPRSLASWLASVNPAGMGLVADHVTGSVGNWRSFVVDDRGLLGVAQADDTPAADVLLAACDDGRAQGFSFKARIVRTHFTDRWEQGLPLVVADEIELQEGGPTPEPSDGRAEILLVGGHTPRWFREQQAQLEAIERAGLVSNLRPRRAGQPWRPTFAR